MTFPVYFILGPLRIHPHFAMEMLAYGIGLYLTLFRPMAKSPSNQALVEDSNAAIVSPPPGASEALRQPAHSALTPPLSQAQSDTAAKPLSPSARSSIALGALVGALVGAKLLVLLQHVNLLWEDWRMYGLLALQGKTIVGALLGGLTGVEVTKRMIGVRQSTGDGFVFSVMVGMILGRIGCFLTGLSDRTYGIATTLPWGVDFGDGVLRHPTQLYEVGFLLVLLGLLLSLVNRSSNSALRSGDRFRLFMIAYLGFRLTIDFIKPDFRPLLGMSAIQFACIAGLIYYSRDIRRFGQIAVNSRRASRRA